MPRFKDLTGMMFNNWLVISRAENYVSPKGYTATYWLCECQCENKTKRKFRAGYLKSGKTKNCGCDKSHYISKVNNLIGKTFGKLTVIERYYGNNIKNTRNKVVWLCKCECGNEKAVIVDDLKSGKVKSCGCLISNAENEIEEFLRINNIIFIKQFIFDNCKNIRVLPFDFAIFNIDFDFKFLIEANGHFHYHLGGFKNAEEKLFYNQYCDMIKQQYCNYNNFDLLIIPYWKFYEKENIIAEKLIKYNLINLKNIIYLYD